MNVQSDCVIRLYSFMHPIILYTSVGSSDFARLLHPDRLAMHKVGLNFHLLWGKKERVPGGKVVVK